MGATDFVFALVLYMFYAEQITHGTYLMINQ